MSLKIHLRDEWCIKMSFPEQKKRERTFKLDFGKQIIETQV
jgi:hypothetical protein